MSPDSLIQAFANVEAPYRAARHNQYKRMADLTRSAANARTGLYAALENRELFIDLHLTELEALVLNNNECQVRNAFEPFKKAIRERKCKEIMCCETALLLAIHKMETRPFLERCLRNHQFWIGLGVTIVVLHKVGINLYLV